MRTLVAFFIFWFLATVMQTVVDVMLNSQFHVNVIFSFAFYYLYFTQGLKTNIMLLLLGLTYDSFTLSPLGSYTIGIWVYLGLKKWLQPSVDKGCYVLFIHVVIYLFIIHLVFLSLNYMVGTNYLGIFIKQTIWQSIVPTCFATVLFFYLLRNIFKIKN